MTASVIQNVVDMEKDWPEVSLIQGHAVGRRGIAWLEIPGNDNINAKEVFDALPENRQRYLMSSFDQWLLFKPDNDRFHGWPGDADFKACHQFMFRYRRDANRLYGFKVPVQFADKHFEICVLATHSVKNTKNTDPFIKKLMVKLSTRVDIKEAILRQLDLYFSKQGKL